MQAVPAAEGDDSLGPIVLRQRTLPFFAFSATSAPSSSRRPPRALHGGRFMNVW